MPLPGPGKSARPLPAGTHGRCGYGPRLPLLVISPYAKRTSSIIALTDQSSILRFIEDNWELGRIGNGSSDVQRRHTQRHVQLRRPAGDHVILNPRTGVVSEELNPVSEKNLPQSPTS